MKIETDEAIYETFFQHAQIEITGKCNMACKHCRALNEAKTNMPIDVIKKILIFAKTNSNDDFRLTISGGEPFIHPRIIEIMRLVKEANIEYVIITTNGSLVTDQNIIDLESIMFKNLCIQVSVDGVDEKFHDNFRSFKGAFNKAIDCLKKVANSKITASFRSTIVPSMIDEIENIVCLAKKNGAERVGFGSVIPVGAGMLNHDLIMTSSQKKKFLEDVSACRKKYTSLDITTEDPLKFAIPCKVWDYGVCDCYSESFFGGCTAGITGFNVDSEGTITPCATLLRPITNVVGKTIQEILSDYVSSKVIHKLIDRNFTGKCQECDKKRLCGGCRAVANGTNGDFLSSDTTCWYK